ncbi:MAG: hypothetical protein M1812_003312 [Candelaria pacifica]|nr:MAG: hypothetical protein M1812_003312 [Candelaria pacifica]
MDFPGWGTAVLMLDLPSAALCGIDLLSFTPSLRFRGIKNLPPGIHFFFTGASASLSVRHGTWVQIGTPRSESTTVIIKKWDAEKEELVEEPDQAVQMRWRANIGTVWDEGLTPYRQSVLSAGGELGAVEETNDWARLTDCITPALLSRITNGHLDDWTLSSASCAKEDTESIPGLSNEEDFAALEKPLGFLPINLKQTWREGAVGRERTEAAKDRSWALGDLIERHCSQDGEGQIIGEMQFTFLMVLTLGNYSCLEQWKRILNLALTCHSATNDRSGLFVKVLGALKLQLQHSNDVEGGLFDFSDEGGAMLKNLLKTFRRGLEDRNGNGHSAIMDELNRLESYVKSEYGWELSDSYVRRGMLELEDGEQVEMEVSDLEGEDERGEYAPVILEVTEAYNTERF